MKKNETSILGTSIALGILFAAIQIVVFWFGQSVGWVEYSIGRVADLHVGENRIDIYAAPGDGPGGILNCEVWQGGSVLRERTFLGHYEGASRDLRFSLIQAPGTSLVGIVRDSSPHDLIAVLDLDDRKNGFARNYTHELDQRLFCELQRNTEIVYSWNRMAIDCPPQ